MRFVSISMFLVLFLFYLMFIYYDFNNVIKGCVNPYQNNCLSPTPIQNSFSKIDFTIVKCSLNLSHEILKEKPSYIANIEISLTDIPQIIVLAIFYIFLLFLMYFYLCSQVNFVTFNTDLSIYKRKGVTSFFIPYILKFLSLYLLGLLLPFVCERDQILLLIIHFNPNFSKIIFDQLLIYSRIAHKAGSIYLLLYSFSISYTPSTCILCLFMFQFWCYSYLKRISIWLPILLILISNDIHLNPGPHNNKHCFTFMSWNLNS